MTHIRYWRLYLYLYLVLLYLYVLLYLTNQSSTKTEPGTHLVKAIWNFGAKMARIHARLNMRWVWDETINFFYFALSIVWWHTRSKKQEKEEKKRGKREEKRRKRKKKNELGKKKKEEGNCNSGGTFKVIKHSEPSSASARDVRTARDKKYVRQRISNNH